MATTSPQDPLLLRRFVTELQQLGVMFPEEIGSGTFSAVFHSWLAPNTEEGEDTSPTEVANKLLWDDVTERRLLKEARVLHAVGGEAGCVKLLDVRQLSVGSVLTTPFLCGDRFEDLCCGRIPPPGDDTPMGPGGRAVHCLGWAGIAVFARRLLGALRRAHSRGVIHRDVKPRNFLFRASEGGASLIDFGLAQTSGDQLVRARRTRAAEHKAARRVASAMTKALAAEGAEEGDAEAAERAATSAAAAGLAARRIKGERAGTPGYRPPEVLLSVPEQGPAVDVWAAGVVIASLVARRSPLLPGRDNGRQLAMAAALVGPERLASAAERLGRAIVRAPTGEPEVARSDKRGRPSDAAGTDPRGDPRAGTASPGPSLGGSKRQRLCPRRADFDPASGVGAQAVVAAALPAARGTMLLTETPARQSRRPARVLPPAAAVYGPGVDAGSSGRSAADPPRRLRAVDLAWYLPLASALPDQGGGADPCRIARLVPRERVTSAEEHAAALLCVSLLSALLDPDPLSRCSADEAMAHPFLGAGGGLAVRERPGLPRAVVERELDDVAAGEAGRARATGGVAGALRRAARAVAGAAAATPL